MRANSYSAEELRHAFEYVSCIRGSSMGFMVSELPCLQRKKIQTDALIDWACEYETMCMSAFVFTYKRYGRVPNDDCMQRSYDCTEYHRRYLKRLPKVISTNYKIAKYCFY